MSGRQKKSKVESTLTKEELQKVIGWNQEKLDKIKASEKKERMGKLVGKCFKYKNCYSMPQGPKDYWWIYAKVIKIHPNNNLMVFIFQIDKNGEIKIEPNQNVYLEDKFSGWKTITGNQFAKAWAKLLSKIVDLDVKYSYAMVKKDLTSMSIKKRKPGRP